MSTFLLGLGERIGLAFLFRYVKILDPRLLLAGFRYRGRLKERLRDMPFLFRDMNLSARDDYVSLDVLTVPGGQVGTSTSALPDYSGPLPKFKAYPRALIFGGGGYGKTTLLRNLALRCLEKRPWQKMFGRRGAVPLYLPLKVVKTFAEFPIMEAIQASDPYFAGHRGLRRITRLGNAGKLIVLLDGYDEMPYTGGFEFVKRELECILGSRSFGGRSEARLDRGDAYICSKFGPAYEAIRRARVYLSSRFEFYEYNSVPVSLDVQKWVVKGLDDRRIELIEKIFSKYRAATVASCGIELSAELFLQELAMMGDASVVELSKSPLFLTVMCYVYAREIGSQGVSHVFSLGASGLSKTCIRLLLEDLDKYKSREVSSVERRAIMNRRSAYADEKYAFLSFFSVMLYEAERSFFDEKFAVSIARMYFSSEPEGVNSAAILRGLDSEDATVNIIKQIVLSGLFVFVDKQAGVRYFDFPHRKFREALATDYFSEGGRIERLLLAVERKPYAELILAFIEQSTFRQPVVESLVRAIVTSRAPHVAVLFLDVLKRLPVAEAESAVLLLLDSVADNSSMRLPAGILNFLPRGPAEWHYFRQKLGKSIGDMSGVLAHRWALVAAKINLSAATSLVEQLAANVSDFSTLRYLVHSPLAANYRSVVVEHYVHIGLLNGLSDLVLADLIQLFYAARAPQEKANFKAWLRDACMSSQFAAHKMKAFACSEVDDEVDTWLAASREFSPAFY